MRTILPLALLCFTPLPIQAQNEDFEISGGIKIKYFLLNEEPDLIKNDYRGYDGAANFEAGLAANLNFFSKISLDVYPYLWYSQENRIARVGLVGEVKYEVWEDWLKIGYGHHSWHNADVDSPHNSGRAQDWLFADFYFWELSDERWRINFALAPRIFLGNDEPINRKLAYESDEPTAWGELAVRVTGAFYEKIAFNLKPYIQLSSDGGRYGILAELHYNVTNNFSFFVDAHYFTTDFDDDLKVGIGTIIKFK